MVDAATVEEYLRSFGLPTAGIDTSELAETVSAQEELVEVLDEIERPGSGTEREYWDPEEDCDPFGGFLTRCDISDDGATGVLDDVTVAIKDNIAVAGMPMTCGSPLLKSYVPPQDATVTESMLEDGARLLGKANMDEFAFGVNAKTMRFRQARNPNDPDHQPGSSSCGSGVVVADGLVDAALGTDTGGSIRFPAAWCGVVGVKPTRGLVSHHGFVQFSKTLDNVGPLAKDTKTAARVLQSIAGVDPKDERTHVASTDDYVRAVDQAGDEDLDLTIGLPEQLFGYAPAVDDVVHEALAKLEARGAELVEVSLDNFEYAMPAWLGIGMTEFGAYFRSNATNYWLLSEPTVSLTEALEEAFADQGDELGDPPVESAAFAQHLHEAHGDAYYGKALKGMELVTDGVDDALQDVDVLASATVPAVAPTWEDGVGDVFELMNNTAVFDLTGHPTVSVPCGSKDGLPVGLQLVGEHFAEADLLALAQRCEDTF